MELSPSMSGTDERGLVLLSIARESIAEALGLGRATSYDDSWLREPGATFITLMRQGRLRGCVGSIQAYRPLWEDVRENARASAFRDSRFPPVERGEVPELRVEVSLLSAPEPFEVDDEEHACCTLRPGIDGVVLECGPCRSTFLPQVWEQLPDPWDFLDHLKKKAGLPPGFWGPGIRLSRYTVTKWKEPER
jgi:AmmeMemoRadiSam system protein A